MLLKRKMNIFGALFIIIIFGSSDYEHNHRKESVHPVGWN